MNPPLQSDRPQSRQPIPSSARLVFQGALFDVLQWEQELFDGTTAVFEKLRRPDTAYVIPVTDDGKVLIAEQAQSGGSPYCGLIGGRIEMGEEPLQAARRELLEEAGVTADSFELWQAFQFLPKLDWAIFVFIARGIRQKSSASPDPGERIRIREIAVDAFVQLVADEHFGDVEIALAVLRQCSSPSGLAEFKLRLSAQ